MEQERCEGRYQVPGQRSEPFEVTYRCGLAKGHPGPHRDDAIDKVDWEPSGKCQLDNCDGTRFDYDSTDSRYGSWFCVKCGGMQLPPSAER